MFPSRTTRLKLILPFCSHRNVNCSHCPDVTVQYAMHQVRLHLLSSLINTARTPQALERFSAPCFSKGDVNLHVTQSVHVLAHNTQEWHHPRTLCLTPDNKVSRNAFKKMTKKPGYSYAIHLSFGNTTTRYWLYGPGIHSRCWRVYFAPVQSGSEAHPASHKMGTGSFPELKRPERGVHHYLHLAPRLKKQLMYTSTFPSDLCGLF